ADHEAVRVGAILRDRAEQRAELFFLRVEVLRPVARLGLRERDRGRELVRVHADLGRCLAFPGAGRWNVWCLALGTADRWAAEGQHERRGGRTERAWGSERRAQHP